MLRKGQIAAVVIVAAMLAVIVGCTNGENQKTFQDSGAAQVPHAGTAPTPAPAAARDSKAVAVAAKPEPAIEPTGPVVSPLSTAGQETSPAAALQRAKEAVAEKKIADPPASSPGMPQASLPLPRVSKTLPPAAVVLGGALAISPINIDFGAVGHEQKDQFTFALENRSAGPLEVTGIKPNCGCMEAQYATGVLQPGEKREGSVKIGFGRSFGTFQKKVAIHVAGKSVAAEIGVNAQFHPTLAKPEKNSLELSGVLGRVIPESSGDLLLRRKIPSTTPLRVEELRVEGLRETAGHLKVEQIVIDANTVKLIVNLLPSHPLGRVTGKVLARVEGLGYQLPIAGNVYTGVRTRPDYFQFGRFFDGEQPACTVELIPCDDRGFKIVDLGVEPPVVNVEIQPRESGGYILLARPITPSPEKPGVFKASVNIETDHPDKRVFEIKVMGVYAGKK